jgi:hypothetical protein
VETAVLSVDAVQFKLIWFPLAVADRLPGAVGGCVSLDDATIVASLVELFPVLASPPPPTVALFVTVEGAVVETFTVSVIGAYELPPANPSLRVQVSVDGVQTQPAPLRAVADNPAGKVSATVTVPVVVPAPLFVTARV